MARGLTQPRSVGAEPRGSCMGVAVQPRGAGVHMGVESLALLPVSSYRYYYYYDYCCYYYYYHYGYGF